MDQTIDLESYAELLAYVAEQCRVLSQHSQARLDGIIP